jgi:hypothetical protein
MLGRPADPSDLRRQTTQPRRRASLLAELRRDRPMNPRETKLSEHLIRLSEDELARKKLEREELIARLRDVTEQRDKLLTQYEAMALQVDESTREIDDALLEAERNARKAEERERLAQQEATEIAELSRQLDAERRKTAETAAQFERYRESVAQKLAEHARTEDPWSLLALAISQIVDGWVAWLRTKIPADSALLPWFDRAVAFAKTFLQLAWKGVRASYDWTKPRLVELCKRAKSEIDQRAGKG